ncbi:hypothetical protein BH10BAC2_BH10BAC2_21810 [soil metagenome]
MRKNNNTYSYFFIAVLLLLVTSSVTQFLHAHQRISSPTTTAKIDAFIKNGIEKINHSQPDAVDLLNSDQATTFLQNSQGNTTFGASHKQKNLIDADNATSLYNNRNEVIQKIKRCTLPLAGELQKILLLFPFHSFW